MNRPDSAGLAVGSGPDGLPRRQGLVLASVLVAAAVGGAQAYFLAARGLTAPESYAGLVAVQSLLLGLLLLAARVERQPLRAFGFVLREPVPATVAFASLLVLLFVVLRVDPGFFFGFGRVPSPPPLVFGFYLLSAPILALAQVGFFVGYLSRTLARTLGLRTSLLLSSAALAAFSTNFSALAAVGPRSAVQLLFETTVVAFVLGMLLVFYFYKARWALLGPVTFASAEFAVTALLPVGATFPSWEYDFAFSLIAFGIVLVVLGIGLREPRVQARRYLGEPLGPRRHRLRKRARERDELRSTLVVVAVVGVAAISVTYALPGILGTSTPLLAIATGSMVPTLERGTLVVIHHVSPSEITVGTIIAFNVACLPAPTVHRVISIVSSGPNWVYQTKGDANLVKDPCTVPYRDVLGAVAVSVPYVGFLILDPLFAAALVVLVVVVSVAWRERSW